MQVGGFDSGASEASAAGGGGGAPDAEAGLDWAAAMERDAFEEAAMQHGLAADDEDDIFSTRDSLTGTPPPNGSGGASPGGGGGAAGGGAAAVCAYWREVARGEAQRLLRLNDESVRHEASWQAEREQWQALRAEVQAELRREARSKALGGPAGGGSPAAQAAADGAAGSHAQGSVAEMQQALRRAQAKSRNLKREHATLEKELSRRQLAVAEMESRLSRLRNGLQ